jgi:hypothetical protein
MCEVCWWEDDGQDDETADEVWGGPNSDLSLSQGRYNFARIGASDWTAYKHKVATPVPNRVPGFPYESVETLVDLPPLKSWPRPWTISFHMTTRDLSTRWKEGLRFLLNHGFEFDGTFEWKNSNNPDWAEPQFMRYIEHDATIPIEGMFPELGRIIVGAWFSKPSGGGARLKLQNVRRFGEVWNEPAVSIDAYVPKKAAWGIFDDLVRGVPLLIANCSPTSWGLPTVAEMTSDFFPVTQFVHGWTYFANPVAAPALLDGFRRRAGPDGVRPVPTGAVLVANRWRAGTAEEQEVHVFLRKELRRLAMTITPNHDGAAGQR